MAKKKLEYTPAHIQALSDREHARTRPHMYIGDTEAGGLHHLVWEAIDNTDELCKWAEKAYEAALRSAKSKHKKKRGKDKEKIS